MFSSFDNCGSPDGWVANRSQLRMIGLELVYGERSGSVPRFACGWAVCRIPLCCWTSASPHHPSGTFVPARLCGADIRNRYAISPFNWVGSTCRNPRDRGRIPWHLYHYNKVFGRVCVKLLTTNLSNSERVAIRVVGEIELGGRWMPDKLIAERTRTANRHEECRKERRADEIVSKQYGHSPNNHPESPSAVHPPRFPYYTAFNVLYRRVIPHAQPGYLAVTTTATLRLDTPSIFSPGALPESG